MSDILTYLWLNIDRFSYMDKSKFNINKNDIELLQMTRRNMIIKPGTCLLLTMILSKNRMKIWSKFKNYFVRNRVKKNLDANTITQNTVNISEPPPKIKIEYIDQNYDEVNKILLSSSRKLSSRKKNDSIPTDDTMNLPRTEPTFGEMYLSSFVKYKDHVRKFAKFKKFTNSNKEYVHNRGQIFLNKTRLIYLPFFIILFLSFYDLVMTYAALYLKYQPLIDEYYEKNNKN
jgi:hypothetical protein